MKSEAGPKHDVRDIIGSRTSLGKAQLPQKSSMVAQTVGVLNTAIQSEAWTGRLPAERKLCEQLVISRGTLRAALACLAREGVLKSRHGRGWEIVLPKKSLRMSSGQNVVLLTPQPLHVLTPFAIFWIDNLREHLSEGGYRLEVRHERACYVPEPNRALEELTRQVRPAGWVLCGTTAAMQRWFSKRALPSVIVGSRHEEVSIPSVDLDRPAACRHAAGLLLAKGHLRLVLINRESGLAGDLECEKSFLSAVEKTRPSGGDASIGHHNGTRGSICRRLEVLVQRKPHPTGFLVSGPKFTLTVLGFLISKGLRLPKDVALISRDDDSFLEFVLPTIARYSTDPRLFARKVSRTVLRLAQGGAVLPRDYRVMPQFVPGETLG